MKAWDIYSFQVAGTAEPHPVVIVSHPDRVANKPQVNILLCTSKRITRAATHQEVILDEADGLDWPTLCKCDLIHAVDKAGLMNRRGHVTAQRRLEIIRTINGSNGWI